MHAAKRRASARVKSFAVTRQSGSSPKKNVGERLVVTVSHDKASFVLLGRPGRRKPTAVVRCGAHQISLIGSAFRKSY